ncbi:hypothetical protein E9531_14020 [Lampropedia puyangensis]|uniref:Prepilin-type N-terminal cleavage/methylation domain-containing protein n=1 Tax=Lampropedia puyangensis TaxID=1330072 RepID=A0A4S8EVW8_9BURK|nr:prepilin-type N-terminal cleavage/methylation domain-containing protein [Lampropedia puyangensis]THT98686.1 hypothetical protein E9531_14020 [Lampropedia puyangensis]
MVSRSRPLQRGVSLIELMVTITVMFFLLLVAVPLTASWIHSAQVGKSKGLLMQATSQAKAIALRNPARVKTDSSEAAVTAGIKLLPNAVVLVCKSDPTDSNCAEGGANVQWRTDLSRGAGVAVTINDKEQGTIGFDYAGMLVAAADFKISKGAEHETGQLH